VRSIVVHAASLYEISSGVLSGFDVRSSPEIFGSGSAPTKPTWSSRRALLAGVQLQHPRDALTVSGFWRNVPSLLPVRLIPLHMCRFWERFGPDLAPAFLSAMFSWQKFALNPLSSIEWGALII
jgi:hypothetical protein